MGNTERRVNELLKKYPADQEGTWRVLGEDPNCDLGGHHHQPELGIFSGKYADVVFMAIDMSGFWQWGAGGDIKLVEIKQVLDVTHYKKLTDKKKELESELEKINHDLQRAGF